MKYRPEIDGLRAVAVIPVVLFHAGFEVFSGGFVGVDVFFVISGYLITTILLGDLDRGDFSILKFYERRARRILPALFVVILFCLPFARAWMLPSQVADFAQSLVAVALFASNILFWWESGYFDTAAEEKPLLHTWSLSVEEQFYVLFPVFLFLIWRLGPKKIFWTMAVICALSLATSEIGWRYKPEANFYFAPTRAWELLSGAMAAMIIRRRGVRRSDPAALAGLLAILFSIFVYDDTVPFPSLYALPTVIGTLLLILHGTPDTLTGRLLSLKPVLWIGLISYSVYLWHQPLLAFARIRYVGEPPPALMGSLALLSIGIGYLSWRFVEQPFRSARTGLITRRSTVFASSCAGLVGMIALGVWAELRDGHVRQMTRLFAGDVNQLGFHKYVDERYADCEPAEIAEKALSWEGFLRCKQSHPGPAEWILLGDSHAEHLFIGLAEAHPKQNIAFYIQSGAPYLDAPAFGVIYQELLKVTAPKRIFMTMMFASPRRSKTPEDIRAPVTKAVRALQAAGHDVILLGDIPAFDVSPEDCLYAPSISAAMASCTQTQTAAMLKIEPYDRILGDIARETGARFIPLAPAICKEGACSIISGDTILYRDEHHLNIVGSKRVGAYLSASLGADDRKP